MEAIRDGLLPPAPIAMLMQFDIRALEEGRVEFGCTLDESVYNPIGVVHGGLVCTLLDTVAGCAVHTTLPAGVAYTSIELKVNYLRAVHATSGPLTAIGRVVKPGRRVAFAEGEVLDARAGRWRRRPVPCWCSRSPPEPAHPLRGAVPFKPPGRSADHSEGDEWDGTARAGTRAAPVAPRPGGVHQRPHRRPARPRRRPRPRRSSATAVPARRPPAWWAMALALRRDRHVRAERPGPPRDPDASP